MTVERIDVLVEELSMETVLRILLPRMLGDIAFEIYPYQGKDDLLQKLPSRLRGYASWLPANWRIVVVLDRDNDDCVALKTRLEQIAADANFRTRSGLAPTRGRPWRLVNRIAIEELEAWYFADWQAVRAAYPKVPATIPQREKYRAPDAIPGGTWEALEQVLQKAGYFDGGLGKVEAARAIATHMDPDRSTSPSFCALRDVLREISQP